jgi:ATP-dependent helicase HrpB
MSGHATSRTVAGTHRRYDARGPTFLHPEISLLPIHDVEIQIVQRLREGNRLVLCAPTGSGKTTQVPQMLLRHGLADGMAKGAAGACERGQIVVLQPRRLATRLVAARVAHEMGVPLGELVGYQTRHDHVAGPGTRIRFLTEGLFLRLIQSHPRLDSVAAVVLDEFHERNLDADLALGLLRRLQRGPRPDLRLIVMSATLDTPAIAAYLDCPVVQAGARTYPVEISYLPRRSQSPPWDLAASALTAIIQGDHDGDVLVFMPGAYEIRRTIEAGRAAAVSSDLAFLPLHGSLSPQEQDAAVSPCPRRKVIVATNVAETSLTIPGVRHVIDSGLARIHHHDPRRQVNVLRVEAVSQASADQRAGRAGREAPGTCIRLWTEADHRARHAHDQPEIRRVELAEPILHLKSMGVDDPRTFPWLDAPPAQAMDQGLGLLKTLGALDEAERLTSMGKEMARWPAHPRLARLMIEAGHRGCAGRAAWWAALVGEPEILTGPAPTEAIEPDDVVPSDLAVRERALALARESGFRPAACRQFNVHGVAARQVELAARQFLDQARRRGWDTRPHAGLAEVLKCLLAVYPDHVARKLDAQRPHCDLPGHKRVVLDRDSQATFPGLILAVEVSDIGHGDTSRTVLALASGIDPQWLQEVHPDRLHTGHEVRWNADRRAVDRVEVVRYGDLVIDQTVRDAAPEEAGEILVDRIIAGDISLPRWNEDVEQWMARVRCVAQWFPDRSLITYDDTDIRVILHELVTGAVRARSRCAGRVPPGDVVGGSAVCRTDGAGADRTAPGIPDEADIPAGRPAARPGEDPGFLWPGPDPSHRRRPAAGAAGNTGPQLPPRSDHRRPGGLLGEPLPAAQEGAQAALSPPLVAVIGLTCRGITVPRPPAHATAPP